LLLAVVAVVTVVAVGAQEHSVLQLECLSLLEPLIQLLLAQAEILVLIRQEVQMVVTPYLTA
jgi:hypothetical protein